MPDPTLQELLQQYQQEAQPSEKHQALLQALQAYDSQTKAFRQLRGRKKLPLITARDKNALIELHKAIGSTADALLKDKDEPEALREIVKKITALSSVSYNALLQYDPAKEPKTLSSLEEDVRTLTLHLGNTELGDRLSGAQSERAPLSFLDAKGNRVSGVFTKKKTLDTEQQSRTPSRASRIPFPSASGTTAPPSRGCGTTSVKKPARSRRSPEIWVRTRRPANTSPICCRIAWSRQPTEKSGSARPG